jgi:hypothetical protein
MLEAAMAVLVFGWSDPATVKATAGNRIVPQQADSELPRRRLGALGDCRSAL